MKINEKQITKWLFHRNVKKILEGLEEGDPSKRMLILGL
jgi:hypothetical protein